MSQFAQIRFLFFFSLKPYPFSFLFQSFCDRTSGDREIGLTGHALATALNDELSEHYRLLSTLEAHLRDDSITSKVRSCKQSQRPPWTRHKHRH